MKNVILVESPTKAKTLTRFLKGKYAIEASMGHIRDLPKGKLGIDIEKDFEPSYVIPKEKRKTVESLKHLVKDAKEVILATDPDREGEAISFHLHEVLGKTVKKGTEFKRIAFHEITEEAINEALAHPRAVDTNLVNAQIARRVLDRIVGYKLSPLLWKKIKRNLSAGRVQSIALRLMVEREKEIKAFESSPYFRIFVSLKNSTVVASDDLSAKQSRSESQTNLVEFELTRMNDKPLEKTDKLKLYDGEYTYKSTTLDKPTSEAVLADLPPLTYTVLDVNERESKRSPYSPYITSTMQQDASRRIGFASRRTMSTAQKLYEEGFITYHRTDSLNLSNQFLSKARAYITAIFGKQYLQPRTFKTKSKVAQEAHEAIRPTTVKDLETVKREVAAALGNDAVRLYELIYKRSLATQMSDARFKSTRVAVKGNHTGQTSHRPELTGSHPELALGSSTYVFEKSGSVLIFDGFLKLWFYEEGESILPQYKVGEKLDYENSRSSDHQTAPPPRYNEASIIGTLEKNGIGRPSTYATIVSTIQDRAYVEKTDGRFVPTEIGITVSDFLVKNFGEIDDIPFTAKMEDELDEIANGEKQWVPMMKEFYAPFEKDLVKAEGEEKIQIAEEKTGRTCPKCGIGELIVRRSRYGKFLACNKFPDCNYTENFAQEDINFLCPKDGGKIVMKKTRKGRTFFGCGNYPNCDFAVWTKEQMMKEAKPAPTLSIEKSKTESAEKSPTESLAN